MKRCIETTYSSRKQSKHNPSIIEIEALFDFGHVLQKKSDSGKVKKNGDVHKHTTNIPNELISPGGMNTVNRGSTLSWTSASTVDDDNLGAPCTIIPFSYLDLDYDFELPVVNLESDLKLMDTLLFNI
ncbi:DEHA2E19426p [Debaryomyces hansenii CBS767]|uniref:DEHA2E19426p n=1 Tax=Debaryomyces hansenii (strain ATCC 36239 / CBS 767 / BCRC 21394 / JCM 1990 / NBRC 0083 / IGC 2968) TaxID=284592 RepID=Q6BNS0_DEBHA|nr:DEHA2E19426p [Debaryomyces hansenii CBS767]CAG88423.2 DEHA2E19426p [Debaryomyces hansenii CBS767]|eukprot:XP_460150.2 DEHA2E19426p [Debaryomyces hansenii CBS767]